MVSKKVKNPAENPCIFCHQIVFNPINCKNHKANHEDLELGESLLCSRGAMHYFCLLLSSGLAQNGSGSQGVRGFLLKDIDKEIKRGISLSCFYCRKNGATIGCAIKSCQIKFHLPCGLKNGCLSQFYHQFLSYCPFHKKPKPKFTAKNSECPICYVQINLNDFFQCSECQHSYHINCIKKMCLVSALHHVKCPMCNNSENFKNDCLYQGFYIPDRDAAWFLSDNETNEGSDEDTDTSSQQTKGTTNTLKGISTQESLISPEPEKHEVNDRSITNADNEENDSIISIPEKSDDSVIFLSHERELFLDTNLTESDEVESEAALIIDES